MSGNTVLPKNEGLLLSARQGRMFKKIWESAHDAIVITNMQGEVAYANTSFLELFKYNSEEIVSKNILRIFPGDYKEEIRMLYTPLSQKDERDNPLIVAVQRSDGVIRYAQMTYSFIFKQRRRIAVLYIIRDVTDQTMLERKRAVYLRVAHRELKNPLTSIMGYVDLIQKNQGYKKNNKIQEYVFQLQDGIDRMSQLIDEYLELSNFTDGELSYTFYKFDFDALVKEIVEKIQVATSSHTIQMRGQTKKYVIADKGKIEQVIITLLTNAVKHSPQAKKIVVLLEADDVFVKFSVVDHGAGIPPTQLKKLFHPYSTHDSSSDGVHGEGFHLPLCREVINYHGGRIHVTSKVGEGSLFTFTIPIIS